MKVKLDPKKFGCRRPQLVKVRAILAWDTPPRPEHQTTRRSGVTPWRYVIQIKPRDFFLNDILNVVDLGKPKSILRGRRHVPVSTAPTLTLRTATGLPGQRVPEHRYNLSQFAPLVAQIKEHPELLVKYKQDPAYAEMIESIQAILLPKPETRYEELRCVGLNYDRDTLVAALTVKLPDGYNGDLCSEGSDEHVAFWVRVYDQIEQQCVWRYLGTASVNVHDIADIPGGLRYAVYLPCDFSGGPNRAANRSSCRSGQSSPGMCPLPPQIPTTSRSGATSSKPLSS